MNASVCRTGAVSLAVRNRSGQIRLGIAVETDSWRLDLCQKRKLRCRPNPISSRAQVDDTNQLTHVAMRRPSVAERYVSPGSYPLRTTDAIAIDPPC